MVEDFLRENFIKVYPDTVFFRPAARQIMLNDYQTDVVYYGGMDLCEPTEKALYKLVLSSAIAKVLVLGIAINWIWLN